MGDTGDIKYFIREAQGQSEVTCDSRLGATGSGIAIQRRQGSTGV